LISCCHVAKAWKLLFNYVAALASVCSLSVHCRCYRVQTGTVLPGDYYKRWFAFVCCSVVQDAHACVWTFVCGEDDIAIVTRR